MSETNEDIKPKKQSYVFIYTLIRNSSFHSEFQLFEGVEIQIYLLPINCYTYIGSVNFFTRPLVVHHSIPMHNKQTVYDRSV